MATDYQRIISETIEDCGTIQEAINEVKIVSPRYGDDFKSLPMIAVEAQDKIGEWEAAISLITQESGIPALAVSDASGATQQAINDSQKTAIELRLPVFSVKAFGAKGDGVTDDRAAIQAAIDAAVNSGGGTVYFNTLSSESEYYALKSTHPDYSDRALDFSALGSQYVRGNVTFYGSNYLSRVVLDVPTNINALLKFGSNSRFIVLDQLYLDANKKADYALHAQDNFYPMLTIRNSRFRNGREAAAIISSYVADFRKTFFEESKDGLVFTAPQANLSAPCTSLTMDSCYALNNTSAGYRFGYVTYVSLNACASDDNDIAYYFGAAYGVNMSGCGSERTRKPLHIESYRGFTLNTFFMLNCGSTDSSNPEPYLIEFGRGTNATVGGVWYEGSARFYNYKLASTSASQGSENVTVTDRSLRRPEIYFVENFAFSRPIKLLRDDQTEKARTYNFSNASEVFSHFSSYGQDYTVDHVTTINLAAGTYELTNTLELLRLDGRGELIIQGVAGDRAAVKIDTAAIRLRLTDCNVKIRLKDLTLISTTQNTSARRLRVTNCPNVVLDNVHIDRNGVNVGYGVSAESGSLVHLINGTEATGPFATGSFVAADTSKFVMERRASTPATGGWVAGMSFEYITPTTHRGAFYNGTTWTDYV